jgi:hypothetical protein
MRKFKLLCVFPNIDDATSFYRGLGPLAELERSGEVEVVITQTFDWPAMIRVNGVFLQRPYKKVHVDIIRLAKSCGQKVWIDYDDDLFTVPMDNPSYFNYSRPEIKEAVKACIQLADKVTVSTKALLRLRQDAVLIPNSINLNYFPFTEANTKPTM